MMKTRSLSHQNRGSHQRAAGRRGMTLPETLTASSVFSLVIVGLLFTQMACMRLDQLTQSKLGASESSRRDFDILTADIRSAKIWRIGNGSSTTFTAISNATTQVGNALQLSSTSDTNIYVRYFFDTNTCRLARKTSVDTNAKVIAQSLTNTTGQSMTFRAENYLGNSVSDIQYKYVIVTTLEFCQFQYPLTKVGPGNQYDYYRLQLKASSHNFN
jgi:hypothetical protein